MLLIRCDANTDIGAGHFFRELALSEAAIDGGIPVLMAMHQPSPTFQELAAASEVELFNIDAKPSSPDDADALRRLALDRDATAVVVDGYQFTTAYYQALGRDAFTLAAVDDIAHQHFPVDFLVNVNPHAVELDYDIADDTDLLLGVEYTLLRRQFRQVRAALDERGGPEVPTEVSRILVTMGGGDPTNETGKVLRALQLGKYTGQVDVVIGPANPHQEELETLATEATAEIIFHSNVRQMAELMNGQHLAICAAGGTSWELACLGLPMVQIVIADNQRPIASWLSAHDIAHVVGWHDKTTVQAISTHLDHPHRKRQLMVRQSMALIDGQGCRRVLEHFKKSRGS